ncbi:hypothetical protein CMK11_16885 [Candidatus Poribacteria bacterium]|nr:hypothetical protein [Candidatus Poribacteria bacterium]
MDHRTQLAWKRVTSVVTGALFLTPILVTVLVSGCAGMANTLKGGAAVAFSNAQRTEEKGRGADTLDAKRALLQKAIDGYDSVVAQEPIGEFANRARYNAAVISTELVVPGGANYEKALTLLQEVVDTEPGGYLAGQARTLMSGIRQNRQTIEDSRRVFDNTPENANEDRRFAAIESLAAVARSYESLRDYDPAIKTLRSIRELADGWTVEEGDRFYKRAAQAQFQIGNVYFYSYYNYIDGWAEYVAVTKDYPKAFESGQAESLLKRAKRSLDTIAEDQGYIQSKLNQKALDYMNVGRHVNPNELFSVFSEQVAQAYLNIAQTWEKDPLRNYGAAIDNYRQLVDLLWSEMFVAADGMFHIGRLYQDGGRYVLAIEAYDELFKRFPQAFRRNDAVYNKAVCLETIREFEDAYEEYRAAAGFGEEQSFFRAAEQKVRQFETDEDGDGFLFYEEQQAGTSDKDPASNPDSAKAAAAVAE